MRGTRSGPSVPASGSVGDRRAKNRLNEGEDSGEPSRAREACGLSWNFSGRPWPSFGEAWVLKWTAGIAHGRLRQQRGTARAATAHERAERGSARQPGRHHGTLCQLASWRDKAPAACAGRWRQCFVGLLSVQRWQRLFWRPVTVPEGHVVLKISPMMMCEIRPRSSLTPILTDSAT